MYPINVVEKETNISKYLLRMWERRYTFPRPERDQKGERVYTAEDVEKLKIIKRLMEEGYRPSKVIHQSLEALKALVLTFSSEKAGEDKNCDIFIVVAEGALTEGVKEALKNQNVKKVYTISSREDIDGLRAVNNS